MGIRIESRIKLKSSPRNNGKFTIPSFVPEKGRPEAIPFHEIPLKTVNYLTEEEKSILEKRKPLKKAEKAKFWGSSTYHLNFMNREVGCKGYSFTEYDSYTRLDKNETPFLFVEFDNPFARNRGLFPQRELVDSEEKNRALEFLNNSYNVISNADVELLEVPQLIGDENAYLFRDTDGNHYWLTANQKTFPLYIHSKYPSNVKFVISGEQVRKKITEHQKHLKINPKEHTNMQIDVGILFRDKLVAMTRFSLYDPSLGSPSQTGMKIHKMLDAKLAAILNSRN